MSKAPRVERSGAPRLPRLRAAREAREHSLGVRCARVSVRGRGHPHIGHGKKRTKPSGWGQLSPSGFAYEFNREHLAHHADPSYFAATWRKALFAGTAVPVLGGLLSPVLGPRRAASFALGLSATYLGYEVVHRTLHTRAPGGRYGRWARRHHLLHHHKTPRNNHGVTSALWDHAFGTHLPAERVRIPRHVAPKWLTEDGKVRPEYQSDYELVGGRSVVVEPAAPGAAAAAAAVVAPASSLQ